MDRGNRVFHGATGRLDDPPDRARRQHEQLVVVRALRERQDKISDIAEQRRRPARGRIEPEQLPVGVAEPVLNAKDAGAAELPDKSVMSGLISSSTSAFFGYSPASRTIERLSSERRTV